VAIKINFIGLVNFFDQGKDGKLVLLPDGRTSNMNIAPHYANLTVLAKQVLNDSGWPPEADQELTDVFLKRYAISEPMKIAVAGLNPGESSETLDTSEWDGRIPLLRQIDPTLHIDPTEAATIAQMPIARGKLVAYGFGEGSTVGQLTVEVDPPMDTNKQRPITITATNKSGEVKKLVLHDGVEIVLTNLSSVLEREPNPTAKPETHFKIYGQLDVKRRSKKLRTPKASTLGQIPSGHPYLAVLRETEGNFPAPDCPVTGCCPG
jgi:hypothetical protein